MIREESQTGRTTTQGHTGQGDSSGTGWTLAGSLAPCKVEGEDPAFDLHVCAVADVCLPTHKVKI